MGTAPDHYPLERGQTFTPRQESIHLKYLFTLCNDNKVESEIEMEVMHCGTRGLTTLVGRVKRLVGLQEQEAVGAADGHCQVLVDLC